jgi:PAS domain S-box-containing protein
MSAMNDNLQVFFDTIQDFLFVLDVEGRIRHMNRTVTERLGYSEAELCGKSVLEVHPPGRRDEASCIVQSMLEGTREYCPVPLMTKAGQLIPVETRVSKGTWDGEDALFGVSKDVTELKRSEAKFSRAFYNNSALMAISTVEDGRFIEVNDAFVEAIGYSRDEIIGRTSKELDIFVHPEQREEARKIFQKDGKVRQMEMEARTKNGEIREGLFSADIIQIGDKPLWLSVLVDLTEKRENQRKLDQLTTIQAYLMRLATDFINLPVAHQDNAINQALETMGTLVEADRAYLFTYDFEAGLMHNTHEWCAKGISPEIDNLQNVPLALFPDWIAAHQAAEETRVQCVADLPKGSTLKQVLEPQRIQSLITLPMMRENECLGFVGFDAVRSTRNWTEEECGLLRVLTEVFANFESKRRVEQELANLNAERAMLLETMDVQVWYLTDLETYGAVNQAHADFVGKGKEEMECRKLSEIYPETVANECRASNEQVYTRKSPVTTEEWMANAVDEPRCLSITKTPKLDEKGDIQYIVCVAHDITETLQLQNQLIEAKNNAEAAGHAKSMFLANMSHEIRTPLNAILGYAQIMDRECGDCEKKSRGLRTIMRSGEHLLELINNILAIVRSDAVGLPLNESDFDLCQLLGDTCRMVAAGPNAKNLSINCKCDANMPTPLHADKGKTAQILLNLLGNAVKFTDTGSVHTHAKIDSTKYVNGEERINVVITVTDTGCGIDKSELSAIFDAFEQAKKGRQSRTRGSGLGLALCKQYADAMHGRITVESEPKQGSTFRFAFPARPAQRKTNHTQSNRESCDGCRLAPGEEPPHILVVDDDEPNRIMLKAMLDNGGFKTELAESGTKTLELLQNPDLSFDLVLLDKRMPPPDGIETMKRIRALEHGDSIKVVIVTASGFYDEGEKMKELGADGFVAKPLHRKALFEVIRRLLGVRFECDDADDQKTDGNTSPQPTPADMHKLVAALSESTLQTLRHAVRRGDINTLRNIVGQIQSDAPETAKLLAPLVEEYNYAAIESVIVGKS